MLSIVMIGLTISVAAAFSIPWYAERTPVGGFYPECALVRAPYPAYSGIAGSTDHYWGYSAADCRTTQRPLGRPQGWLLARVDQYQGNTLIRSSAVAANTAATSYAIAYDPYLHPSADSRLTIGNDYQSDLGVYLAKAWGAVC